jgi:nucleoside-diphosphate-sugar epimerase
VKLLLLGGPKFVGRALIEAALAAGYTIGVYADFSEPIPEDAPLAPLADGHPDDELLPDYANRKVAA